MKRGIRFGLMRNTQQRDGLNHMRVEMRSRNMGTLWLNMQWFYFVCEFTG
jgi:hypothetical protein